MGGDDETHKPGSAARRSVFGLFKKRASLVQDTIVRRTGAISSHATADLTSASLFRLPTELLLMVVVEVSFADIIRMRATCRKAQELLSKGDILQEWMLRQASAHHNDEQGDAFKLYAQLYPPTNGTSIEYLMNQHRRLSAAIALATNLKCFVKEFVSKQPDSWALQDTALSSVIVYMTCPEYAQIKDKLVPCLLIIQHYLETLKSKIYDLAKARWTDTSSIWAHVHEVTFRVYKQEDVLSAHETFQVLCWLMARLLDPSGFRARRIIVLGKRALSDEDVRLFVVLANLRSLALLVRTNSYKAREKMVLKLIRSHDPTRNKDWLDAWSAHRPEYSLISESSHAVNVVNLRFGFQDVWMRAAMQYLAKHNLQQRAENVLEVDRSGRRTIDGYTDIAG